MSSSTVSALDPTSLSDDERVMIADKCREAQRQMQRIQYVDPIARVNRGNAYANISKLMSAMGSRAAYNSFSVPAFISSTNAIQSLRQDLTNTYTDYEIALRDLVVFDCVNKPVEFYKRLTDVRAKRARVAATITAITTQLDLFSKGLLELQLQMKARL